VALLGLVQPAEAQTASHVVDVIKVEGIVDRTVRDDLVDTLRSEPANAVAVIQLDATGTLGVDAARVAREVANAPAPVVVWVGPPGSVAQGGALLLVEAAAVAASSPNSGIGPGRPLDLGMKPSAEDPAAVARAATLAATLARDHGRDPNEAAALVRSQTEELPAQAALDRGLIDLAASSVPDLLAKIDGRRVTTPSGERTLVTRGRPDELTVRFRQLGPVARVLHAAATPTASYLLIVLGLWALAFEVTQPGFGLAGATAALLLALGGYSLVVLPVGWLGFGLLVGGLAALTLDVLLRRLGPLSLLGTVAFTAGSILIYRHVAPAIDLSPWLIGFAVLGSVLYFGFAMTAATRAREAALTARQVGLVGLAGEAASDLDPEGQVVVKGAMWKGRSLEGSIPGGTRIRVRRVDGLTLEVTPEQEG